MKNRMYRKLDKTLWTFVYIYADIYFVVYIILTYSMVQSPS